MEIHKLDVEQTNLIFLFKILSAILVYDQKVNVGNDQEIAQSETNFHSQNRGGKTKLTTRICFLCYRVDTKLYGK